MLEKDILSSKCCGWSWVSPIESISLWININPNDERPEFKTWKSETVKKNIRIYALAKIFWKRTSIDQEKKYQELKNSIKLEKKLLQSKGNNWVRKQPTEWENFLLAIYLACLLIYIIYKELKLLHNRQLNQ